MIIFLFIPVKICPLLNEVNILNNCSIFSIKSLGDNINFDSVFFSCNCTCCFVLLSVPFALICCKSAKELLITLESILGYFHISLTKEIIPIFVILSSDKFLWQRQMIPTFFNKISQEQTLV